MISAWITGRGRRSGRASAQRGVGGAAYGAAGPAYVLVALPLDRGPSTTSRTGASSSAVDRSTIVSPAAAATRSSSACTCSRGSAWVSTCSRTRLCALNTVSVTGTAGADFRGATSNSYFATEPESTVRRTGVDATVSSLPCSSSSTAVVTAPAIMANTAMQKMQGMATPVRWRSASAGRSVPAAAGRAPARRAACRRRPGSRWRSRCASRPDCRRRPCVSWRRRRPAGTGPRGRRRRSRPCPPRRQAG